jgi:hypothetical protein
MVLALVFFWQWVFDSAGVLRAEELSVIRIAEPYNLTNIAVEKNWRVSLTRYNQLCSSQKPKINSPGQKANSKCFG